MKAYEVREPTGLDGLVLNTARSEPQPAHGQILVRMRAAALNYRDQGVIKGAYGYTKFPVIPLSDGAGEVVAVGAGVTQFKVGDRVASNFFVNWTGGRMPADASRNSLGGMIDGVLSEYVLLNDTGAIKIPDHLSFEEAATLPCAALTAWNAVVETAQLKAGETIAILGTGGVSCFALAFAKMHGAFAFLTSSSDEKLARAKALGADALINYSAHAGLGAGNPQANWRRWRRSCHRGRRRRHARTLHDRCSQRWHHLYYWRSCRRRHDQSAHDQPQVHPSAGYPCRQPRHVCRDEQSGGAAPAQAGDR